MLKKIVMAGLFTFLLSGNAVAQRVVVAGGSLVELLWALDVGDRVVGVDETTSWPLETQKLPRIGYWKQLNSEGILSLRPDIFITWQDAEPQLVLEQLKKQKVRVVTLPRTPATLEQLYANIHTLASVMARPEKGNALVDDLRQRFNAVTRRIAQQQHPVSVMFLLAPGGGTPQVAGSASVAGAILTLAGGRNVASHANYKTYGGEAIIAARPDVIVVTTQSMAAGGGKKQLESVAGMTHTPAWKNQRIIEIDQALILGMGPRVMDAIELLQQQLYP